MAGNSFGQIFKITSFGESHGGAVGVVVDGCPAGMKLSVEDVQLELDRRRPGQSVITTPRAEEDKVMILSGVFEGKTTGTPIMMMVKNKDARGEDYVEMKNLYRPSHADFVYERKYGVRDWRGGGRSSARETLARVAAGAVARKFLKEKLDVEILAFVEQVKNIRAQVDYAVVKREAVEANILRCPDVQVVDRMIECIEELRDEGDSCGGVIGCVMRGVPIGLGEPVFDKLPADLGKAMLSINAVKGFEIGSGFAGVEMKGSEHNDEFRLKGGEIRMKTNYAGGCLGGISCGENIEFRVAFKPTSTIMKPQRTVNIEGKEVEMAAVGRHDPCVLPRAVPIVEAMGALVLMDHYLRSRVILFD